MRGSKSLNPKIISAWRYDGRWSHADRHVNQGGRTAARPGRSAGYGCESGQVRVSVDPALVRRGEANQCLDDQLATSDMASRAGDASVSLPLAGRVAVQGVEIVQPAQGFCDWSKSDRRGAGMGKPAVAGVEATIGSDSDERGIIHAESREEWRDAVAADIGRGSTPRHQ